MNFKIEDSTNEKVPSKFEEIIKDITRKRSTQSLESIRKDLFLTLVVYIMTENGFLPVFQKTVENCSENNIAMDKISGLTLDTEKCEIDFILVGFDDITVKLILCPLGITVLVNVFISDVNSDVYSVCFSINQYVVSPEALIVPMIFRNLKHFSNIFKNKIITPVKSSIRNFYGYSSASLLGLPEELLFNIFLRLPINDIINVSQTCKKLALLLKNRSFWHKLLLRDFKNELVGDKDDLKKIYKDAYIAEQESRQRSSQLRCRTGTLHDLMDLSDFVSYIDNPLWDVII
ncbi:uncharacterized protein LOC123653578 [Melitaea cinxia]|uniref:uncharacterized protein LOC123653578 n=1 Tax=Melitaea cinxia TaxID=113334 RepID=UPI001E2719E2|nr:uncharacterized protein LOC123653578 [Melitaea cinxia]